MFRKGIICSVVLFIGCTKETPNTNKTAKPTYRGRWTPEEVGAMKDHCTTKLIPLLKKDLGKKIDSTAYCSCLLEAADSTFSSFYTYEQDSAGLAYELQQQCAKAYY